MRGDGALAYSYAAPTIQRIFLTADIFMGMVESAYQPVRNPRNYAFGKGARDGRNSIVQQVLITGADGKRIRGGLYAGAAARRRLPHHRRQPQSIQLAEHLS